MNTFDLVSLCELLSKPDRWNDALARLRVLLEVPSLVFRSSDLSVPVPTGFDSPSWSRPIVVAGQCVGYLQAGFPPADEELVEQVVSLITWARAHHEDVEAAKVLVNDVRRVASSALDFSEFVTWLLHAADEKEVEKLGTYAAMSLLHADEGAILRREFDGWFLKLPSRQLSVPISRHSKVFGRLLSREDVELERDLYASADEVEQQLVAWGFSRVFAVALDSGDTVDGILFALSNAPFAVSAEARISTTQLAILVSVTLERFAQERRLEEHRRSLEDALRIAHMGTWELSLVTDEMTWSPELHRIYGGPFKPLTQPSTIATSRMELEAQLIQKSHLRDLLLTGETPAWTTQVKTFDERLIWTRSSCELIRDSKGRATRIRGVTRDVTVEVSSQLDRERALNRATRYERLFSMSDTIAVVCTADGIIEEASPSWTRQLGYSANELHGVNIATLLHPDDRTAVLDLLDERAANEAAAGAVLRLKNRSGAWRWLSWTAATDGKHVYAAATDITSLQETSQRLKLSEAQLRQAGSIARIGGWSLDLVSSEIIWSDEVRRLYEVPADFHPRREDMKRFYDPASYAVLKEASRAAAEDGATFDLELQVITWSGRRIYARHQATVEVVDGQPRRFVGALQDVTEQRVAREAAVEASRVKSQFLANTSHEIRTPLNGILGMTRLALDTHPTEEQREYLEAVRVSGENLLAIVNDVLDISKIESGKLELEQAPFSLRQSVFEAARNQASRAHARNIELVVDFSAAVAEQYYGDAVRVGQVAANLIGNAVKFTEHGQILVDVRGNDAGVEICVQDTGIGIPVDRIDRIFEAFTQADGSTNRRFGGTGLGLTITLQLVKQMGGMIHVNSTPGKGSSFRIELPLKPVERAGRLPLMVHRGTALVVSDNPASREATSRLLAQLGFEAVRASSKSAVAETLEMVLPPQFVVIDQELNETTGLELSEAFQLEETLRVIPRVLLTRTTARPSVSDLDAAGVRRVLSRPVSFSELTHAVLQLDRGAQLRPEETPPSEPRRQRQLKVLLAEDNAINARLAQRLCERLGHQVVHVVNGALAVSAIERETWDVVLMDMQMPELDGLEATRRIRNSPLTTKRRNLPIIALTASAMKGDDELCLAAGMDAYLTKPLDPEKLAAVLQQMADRSDEGFSEIEQTA